MNIYDYKVPSSGEDFSTLFENRNTKIVRIVSSDILEEIEYCQEEDEFVILLEGSAVLEIEGSKITLNRGDTLLIPAKTRHKVLSTQKGTLWIAIHAENGKLKTENGIIGDF